MAAELLHVPLRHEGILGVATWIHPFSPWVLDGFERLNICGLSYPAVDGSKFLINVVKFILFLAMKMEAAGVSEIR